METDSGTQLQVVSTKEVFKSTNTGDKKVKNVESELLFLREKIGKTRM